MNFDKIIEMWNIDSAIPDIELDSFSLSIPSLHNKYFKLLSSARYNFKKIENEYKKLYLLKYEYYQGILDEETLKENNWLQCNKKILKGDIPIYIASDEDIIKMKMKIAGAFEKLDFLENIIKQINAMQWNIKNSIDFMKFQAGD